MTICLFTIFFLISLSFFFLVWISKTKLTEFIYKLNTFIYSIVFLSFLLKMVIDIPSHPLHNSIIVSHYSHQDNNAHISEGKNVQSFALINSNRQINFFCAYLLGNKSANDLHQELHQID